MENDSQIRRQTKVRWSDEDFTIRSVTIEQLLDIQRADVTQGWSRRWSSEEELLRQVSPEKKMFLCPLFRNGGPINSPESYRCWLWFTINQEVEPKGVTLLDVGKDLYWTLPEMSTESDLKRVISIMFNGVTHGCRFESIW
ncbi:hypothetical protein [Streptomyces iconiensis]|uniref:Uncharacterized protein n=1 Tax=Streptomyces iconiensis TaxID=1384038 RepID=A0ABT7A454_9ACTN|nr:hypothetical protein [Streptomyces iconiensis]MDJ1136066.1 hypothetical protein [Streptomyces iconiensis]